MDLVTFTEEILHGKLHFLCSERFSKNEKKEVKELYIEPEKIIRSNDYMPVNFEADFVPEKQSSESKVDANDSPKVPLKRENSNEIEVIEDTRNKENITVIATD